MANEYYERLSEMNPGDLADGLAMEAEFDAISQGFSKLPTPHTGGQGFYGPVRVGDAVNADEAVTKAQLDKALGKAKSLAIATYGDLNAEAWAALDSGTYLLFGTGAQLTNFPATLVAGATYCVTVRHAVGDVGVSLYLDELAFASTDDAANVDLGRAMVRVGATLATAISAGWKKAQPLDATLTAMAGVDTSADKFIYFDGVDSAKSTPLTAFGRSLLDDVDAATALTTLGAYPKSGGALSGNFWLDAGARQFGAVLNLGPAGDGKPSLVVLAKKYVGTLLDKSGFVGRVLYDRGSASSGWQSDFVDLAVSSAHSTNAVNLLYRYGNTVSNAKIVEVTYNGAIHFALYRPAGSSAAIIVTGHAFGQGLPVLIPDATAYTITDVITTDSMYHTRNVVGTVSQSAGVPTGAIIERGSNANGEYVKFADGTVFCSVYTSFPGGAPIAIGPFFKTTVGYTWTFPFTFLNKQSVVMNAYWNDTVLSDTTHSWLVNDRGPGADTASSARIRIMSTATWGNLTFIISGHAVGRWF
ncbi:hypothetical protein ACV1C6_16030 [Aeromonas sanarellii]